MKTEKQLYVSGVNCSSNPDEATEQFYKTKKVWNKEGGIVCFHGYQSFGKGEVTPEIAGMILKAKVNLNADGGSVLETGCIGNIGGCKIFVSNNVDKVESDTGYEHKCFARTNRAIAFAEQLSEIDAYRPELRFADAVKGLHLYGAKVVYPAEMVLLNLSVSN